MYIVPVASANNVYSRETFSKNVPHNNILYTNCSNVLYLSLRTALVQVKEKIVFNFLSFVIYVQKKFNNN